jgi:hypothetical protein
VFLNKVLHLRVNEMKKSSRLTQSLECEDIIANKFSDAQANSRIEAEMPPNLSGPCELKGTSF